jgi:hypothetical protein
VRQRTSSFSAMRFLLNLFASAFVAGAQSSATLDDLQHRATESLNSIPLAENWQELERNRAPFRLQLEEALGLRWAPVGRTVPASVYTPKELKGRTAAVILLRPHRNPTEPEVQAFPSALAELGLFVIEVDARADHEQLKLLAEGITPQTLIQQSVGSALAFLKSNESVDSTRIALAGEGLASVVAAAIHPEIAVAVMLSGLPDLHTMVRQMRALNGKDNPDHCTLVPGLFRFVTIQRLVSLIAPRPLLVLHAVDGPLQDAMEVYRMAGATEPGYTAGHDASPTGQFRVYSWLARHLQQRQDVNAFTPSRQSAAPFPVELQTQGGPGNTQKMGISEQLLSKLFGTSLDEGHSTLALNCHPGPQVFGLGNKRVNLFPQTGIEIPATVLRPGSTGCDAARGTLIAISDKGRSDLVSDEIVQEANRRGWIVWMLDVRGIGELATQQEAFVSAMSLLLGEHFSWRQATDVLRILRRVGGAGSRDPTALYARGKASGLAATYVAATAERRELAWTVLRDGPASFRKPSDSPQWMAPYAALQHFDIPDLWQIAKSNVYVIESPEEFIRKEW